jgi:hypothetical protein
MTYPLGSPVGVGFCDRSSGNENTVFCRTYFGLGRFFLNGPGIGKCPAYRSRTPSALFSTMLVSNATFPPGEWL